MTTRFHGTALRALLIGVGALASCVPPVAEESWGGTCPDALRHLESCVAQHCRAHDDALCEVLSAQASNSLFGSRGATCATMKAADVAALGRASCDDIINNAQLLSSGRADFACPSYFPWCNELQPRSSLYHVNVLSSVATGASLEVLVGEVGRQTIIRDGTTFQTLSLEGAGTLNEPGRPAVPTISFLVGLPPTTDEVRVASLERSDEWEVSDLRLAPHVPSNLEDAPPEPFVVDESFYQKDTEYPGADYAVDKISTWRNYRVVRVTLYPFRYNPARQRLSVARRLALRLSFLDTKPEPTDTVNTGEKENASAYSGAIVNYPETAGSGVSGGEAQRTRYLIIAHDPLVEAVMPLVDLKKRQGLPAELVKLSDVGSDPLKIKARIAKAYADSSIEYVLLVGDVDDLPMYVYELPETSFYSDDAIPGDYWYGLLAGDDLLPEVAVGRIAGKTPAEVAIHVAKTVAYETSDARAAWQKKILMVAHGELYPHKYTACAEEVRTRTYQTGPVDFTKLYGGEQATAEDIVREVNSGIGIIGYRGHGSATAWLGWNGTDFSAGKEALTNGAMTPVVFSVACLNLSMQEQEVSHGEQWVQHPGGGAVGFLGSTKRSWTSPNDVFMKHLFRGLLDEGVTTVGPLINRARAEMIKRYAVDDSGVDNAMMYLWLGDPSLRVGGAFQRQAQPRVGWCNTQWPPMLTMTAGASETVYGQVWAGGVTEAIGRGEGVEAALGFGPVGTTPTGEGWTWVPAQYGGDKGNNDEYRAQLHPQLPGTYSYVMRFRGAHDAEWTNGDLDGSQNGFDSNQLGVLTVQ